MASSGAPTTPVFVHAPLLRPPLKGLGDENSESAQMEAFPKSLGFMPNTNNMKEVVMKMGPYGPYVELVDHTIIVVPSAEQVEDESEEEDGSEKKKTKKTKKATQKTEKPRRVGVSNIGKKPEEVTLEDALYFRVSFTSANTPLRRSSTRKKKSTRSTGRQGSDVEFR